MDPRRLPWQSLLAIVAATAQTLIVLAPRHATGREIGPGADLCGEIRAVPPGEERVLGPGDYQGPCAIRHGGGSGAPLVIRAADPARWPRHQCH